MKLANSKFSFSS